MLVLDATARAALDAALAGPQDARESACVLAIVDRFAGQHVTIELRSSGDVLLGTVVRAAWSTSLGGDTKTALAGAHVSWTHAANGTPARAVFKTSGGVAIFETTAGVGTGEYQVLAAIASGVPVDSVPFALTAPQIDVADSFVETYSQSVTWSQTGNMPVTFLGVFSQGEVPAGQTAMVHGVTGGQVIPWTTFPDGSLHTAAVSAVVSATAGVPADVEIGVGSPVLLPDLTELDLTAAGAQASVMMQSIVSATGVVLLPDQSVTLSSVIGQVAAFGADPAAHSSGLVRTIPGPWMTEFHYYAKTADRNLRVWWFVRLYRGGRYEVETRVTNGWLMTGAGHRRLQYVATVMVGGTQRFTGTVVHQPFALWSRVDWDGTDPGGVPTVRRDRIMAARLTATYPDEAAPSTLIDGLLNATRAEAMGPLPGTRGAWPAGWGSGGENTTAMLGLANYPTALALQTGNTAAHYAALAADRMHGRYQLHYVDPTTGRAPLMTTKASLALGPGTGLWYGDPGGAITQPDYSDAVYNDTKWDLEHQGEAHLWTWLTEARWSSADLAQLYATASLLAVRPDWRETVLFRFGGGTERGEAWGLRTAVTALMSTPDWDTAMRAELVSVIEGNVDHYHTQGVVTAPNVFGIVAKRGIVPAGLPANSGVWNRNWMSSFLSAVLGYAALASLPIGATKQAKLVEVARQAGKGAVGLLGEPAGWNWRHSNYQIYSTIVSSDIKVAAGDPYQSPVNFYSTWAESYAATLAEYAQYGAVAASTADGLPLLYDMQGGNLSTISGNGNGTYYAMRNPALAYAVDLGVPGAGAAYTRLHTTTTTFDLHTYPRYNVEPRGSTAPGAEVVPPIGQARMIAASSAFQAVRPAGLTAGDWKRAVFGSYGSGAFNSWASAGGKWQITASGGHAHQSLHSRLSFDLGSQAWERQGYVSQPDDATLGVSAGAITSDEWQEMIASGIPAPAHLYAQLVPLPTSEGGVAGGSILLAGRKAVNVAATGQTGAIHRVDMTSGTVTRVTSAGGGFPVFTPYEMTAILDDAARRLYLLDWRIHQYRWVQYWDFAAGAMQTTQGTLFPYPSIPASAAQYAGPSAHPTFFQHGRLLVWAFAGQMVALNLDAITVGWQPINLSGTFPSRCSVWVWHPARGAFYARPEVSAGNTLIKVVPGANPLVDQWVVSTVTLSGDAIPEWSDATGLYRTLFYAPAQGCLGFVHCDGAVYALNPT